MTMENDNSKPVGCSKSSSKEEVYSNTILAQETRKTPNRQPKFTPKILEKEQQQQKKISKRKEIINEKEMKEKIVKINGTKIWFFEKINKIGRPLARVIKKKERRSNQQN